MTNDNLAFRRELVALLPRLRRFALALSGERDAAEDLLQSAVEKALRGWESFERGRRLESWMFKIMQNVWLDMKRSAAVAPKFTNEFMDAVGEDGRSLVEVRDDFRMARRAFEALPDDQRAVVTLVVVEGFSYAAAAETLGVPIGTVMSRLSRARASLASNIRGTTAITQVRKETH